MKPILPLLALLILGLTAAPAQERAALPPLPGDTAWVLHLDWSRLLAGELGAWVDARLGADSTAPAAAPAAAPVHRLIVGLQALEAATGRDRQSKRPP